MRKQKQLPDAVYELYALTLCLLALGILAAQSAVDTISETGKILTAADYVVCGLFFIDFVVSSFRAERFRTYFFTWGWIDLLSSLPAIEILRIGRAARILRILRVLRGLRAARMLASAILNRRAESAFLAAALVSLLLIIFSSVSILQLEQGDAVNIKTAEDALWWSISTITTVGYGDRFPVTSEGRVLGAILMIFGVGLFGTLSGFVASWFVKPDTERQESEIQLLSAEISAMRAEMRERNKVREVRSAG